MQNWLPYLQELLGQDRQGQQQAQQLITFAEALDDKRLLIMDRVRLIDGLTHSLDDIRLLFLLPGLVKLFADPSIILRRRVLSVVDKLQGGSYPSLRDALTQLIEREPSSLETLKLCLDNVVPLFQENGEFAQHEPLESLRILRSSRFRIPVLGMAVLLGIHYRLENLSDEFKNEFENFFQNEEQSSQLKQFEQWLTQGPLFLRYLMIQWFTQVHIMSLNSNLAKTLYDCYRNDPDPLLTGMAIEAFAQCVEQDDLESALKTLEKEYSHFCERPLKWSYQSASESVKIVSQSILKALGHLAVASYPRPEPLNFFRKLINTPHKNFLDLNGNTLSSKENQKILCASALLYGSEVLVKIRFDRQLDEQYGWVGSSREQFKLTLQNPPNNLGDPPRRGQFWWVFPIVNSQFPDEPLRWHYQLHALVHPKQSAAMDLSALNSPLLSYEFSLREEKIPSRTRNQIRDQVESAMDQRGWCMSVVCNIALQIILAGFKHHDSLDTEPLSLFFNYLINIAFGTEIIRIEDHLSPNRLPLRNQMRRIFLTHFAREDVFKLLFPSDQLNVFQAQYLSRLARTTLRALPGDVSNQLIEGNHSVLLAIAQNKDLPIQIRGTACLALCFHVLTSPSPEIHSIQLSGKDVFERYPSALSFISEEDLERFRKEYQEYYFDQFSPEVDPITLMSGSSFTTQQKIQRVMLWTEILARHLERNEESTKESEYYAGICLQALTIKSLEKGLDVQGIIRRLLYSFAVCKVPSSGRVRQLYDHLLRTASSAGLQMYFKKRAENQQNSGEDDFNEQLIRILSEEHEKTRLSFNQFVDLQLIADRLAHQGIILAELAAQASKDFFLSYLKIRENHYPALMETDTVVPAKSQLNIPSIENTGKSICSVLVPDLQAQQREALADVASDLLATWVHYPDPRAELRCLVKFYPKPTPHTIDFHNLSSSAITKQAILKERLDTQACLDVLARVIEKTPDGKGRVDLGVEMPGELSQQQAILEQLPSSIHQDSVLSVRLESRETTEGARQIHAEVVSSEVNYLDGRVIQGTLVSSAARPSSKWRTWEGQVAGLKLPVRRRKLTGDLSKLFDLDEKSWQLSTPCFMKVVREGETQQFSVLAAPPRWRSYDLILAVLSKQVDHVTFLEGIKSTQQMLFEVGWKEEGISLTESLGILVLIEEGEILDSANKPLTGEQLKGGTKFFLQIEYSDLKSIPHLKVLEEERLNVEFRQLFQSGSLVKVKKLSAQDAIPVQLELLIDSKFENFPKPTVCPPDHQDRAEGYFVHAEQNKELDAIVTSDWKPEAEDYTINITEPESYKVVIEGEAKEKCQTIRRYMTLEPGSFFENEPKHFSRDRNGNLNCSVNNIQVFLEPLLDYLLPDQRLLLGRKDDISVCLIKVGKKDEYNFFDYPRSQMKDFNYFTQRKQKGVKGFIFQTPYPNSGSKQIGVYWIEDSPNEPTDYYEEIFFDCPADKRFYNGDILCAHLEPFKITRTQRSLTGTVLHQVISLQDWLNKNNGQKPMMVTLLRISKETESPWLFTFPPAQLVEVMPSQLTGQDRLQNAWPLDKVFLTVREERVNVTGVQPNPLRNALGQRCTLEIKWYHYDKQQFDCTLKSGGKIALPLQLNERDLQDFNPKQIIQRLKSKERNITIDCTLSDYSLKPEIDENGTRPIYRFALRPTLSRLENLQKEPSEYQKPSLIEELKKWEGQILRTHGEVNTFDQTTGRVKLSDYQHPDLLPLPLAEQTWIRHTGALVPTGWKGRLAILRDEQGKIFASLRRLKPQLLVEWLKGFGKTRPSMIIENKQPFYYGKLTPEEMTQCGYTGIGPWILFEIKPGETFVATPEQLKFLEQPFDTQTLHYGDRILKFQVITSGKPGELGINILHVELDVRYEIEHFATQQKGVHVGCVRKVGKTVELLKLKGGVRKSRLGRWQLQLEKPDEGQLEKPNETDVYLRFVRANEQTGELIFRFVATEAEVFMQKNLVYVKSTGKISPYGGSRKLEVEPISELYSGKYFIPDTLYSERRWQLLHSKRVPDGIFLAQVKEVDKQGKKLSLIDTPRRRFGAFMKTGKCQAIVKKQEDNKLEVELNEGVNAELPLEHLDGYKKWQSFNPGDILFLERQRENDRVTLTGVVRNHFSYLDFNTPRTLLTELWGGIDHRRKKYQQGSRVSCSLIGFPQLEGLCRVSETNLDTHQLLPQMIEGLDGKRVLLAEGIDPHSVVGQLKFNESGQPQLRTSEGTVIPLLWEDVTCYEGNLAARRTWLTRLTWRNKALSDKVETIQKAELIARFDPKQNRASLTKFVNYPCPVDHFIEQFPKTAVSRLFVVGKVETDKLILECAPGRYVELPTNLLLSAYPGKLNRGLAPYWGNLTKGDVLSLQRDDRHDLFSNELFPSFQVRYVQVQQSRYLQIPFVTMLHNDPEDILKLGPREGAGIPAGHLQEWLKTTTTNSTPCCIRGEKGTLSLFTELPKVGDSVMVYCPDRSREDNYRVLGYENFQLQWRAEINDPLDLHQPEQRKGWLEQILSTKGAILWATIEEVDPQEQTFILSRRVQLEKTQPLPGQVVRARVRGTINGQLWIEILGIPYCLSLDEFCYGHAPSTWGDKLGRSHNNQGKEIEVTLNKKNILSCKAVYQFPKANEFDVVVDSVFPEGILVMAEGCFLSIPITELSYCELNEELLQRFFPPHTLLRIAKTVYGFSHVRSNEMKVEINELKRTKGPLYVTKEWVDESKQYAIVRGRSGVLMGLQLPLSNDKLEKQFDAYLKHIDPNSHQILLSLKPFPIRRWGMPTFNKDFAIDSLTSQVIDTSLLSIKEELESLRQSIVLCQRLVKKKKIRDKLRSFGCWYEPRNSVEAVEASIISHTILDWINHQTHLEPNPRNIRLILETLNTESKSKEFPKIWGQVNTQTNGTISRFYRIGQELCSVLSGTPHSEPSDNLTHFAVGYWWLLQGATQKALLPLQKASEAEDLQDYFDIQFTLARALYLSDQKERATQLLKTLISRLWNNALGTLSPPLLEPDRYAPRFFVISGLVR